MEFQDGAKVVDHRGETVGHLYRVVLDPRTKAITHLVVRKGLLFTTDRVLPVWMVADATADRVQLQGSLTERDLSSLPEFEETEYLLAAEEDYVKRPQAGANGAAPVAVSTHAGAPAVVWYPTTPSALASYADLTGPAYVPASDYITQTKRNIPDNTVALKDGAHVYSADGQHVGDVERVIADSGTRRATHVLVSHGLLFKTHTPLPVTWIETVTDTDITLAVSEKQLRGVPKYKD